MSDERCEEHNKTWDDPSHECFSPRDEDYLEYAEHFDGRGVQIHPLWTLKDHDRLHDERKED